MRLIINADDFGLTQSVNAAILELASYRTISSTTVMVNMPFSFQATELLALHDFGIGLHFNLTEGRPISNTADIPSLVDGNGEFYNHKRFVGKLKSGSIDSRHVHIELKAQYERLYSIIGDRLTHIDSHQGVHRQARIYSLVLKFASSQRIGVRASSRFFLIENNSHSEIINPLFKGILKFPFKRFVVEAYYALREFKYQYDVFIPKGELLSVDFKKLEALRLLLRFKSGKYRDDVFEISCHPSKDIMGLNAQTTKLVDKRVFEYQFLSSQEFIEYAQKSPLYNFSNAKTNEINSAC